MKCEACRHVFPASLGHTKDDLTTDRPQCLQVWEAPMQVYLATPLPWDAVRTCPRSYNMAMFVVGSRAYKRSVRALKAAPVAYTVYQSIIKI